MFKKGIRLGVLVLLSMAYSGCSKTEIIEVSDQTTQEPENFDFKVCRFYTHPASSGDWKYFSFKQGKFIELSHQDAAENLNWDIAFERSFVRTNSGQSGKGRGGATNTKKKNFDDVKEVPSTFVEDTYMGKNKELVNPEFCVANKNAWTWYFYMQGWWAHNDNVFVVRTADGKSYAKLIMRSYRNDKNDPGHITFEYIYPFK